MGLIVKGQVVRKVYERDTFRIYAFLPNSNCSRHLVLNKYNNIAIKGEIPELFEMKEYELEVEYSNDGKYESYNVININTDISNMSNKEAYDFLETIIGKTLANNILNEYPNFIKLMVSEDYNSIDINKIAGMGNAKFEYVKGKIDENIKFFHIITYYKDYQLTMAQVKKMYDKYSSFEILKENMNQNPYQCLCSIGGISFKTADNKILAHNPELIDSKYRLYEAILHVLCNNENDGHTWLNLHKLMNELGILVPQCMEFCNEVFSDNDRLELMQIGIYIKENKVARRVTFMQEKAIAEKINLMLDKPRKWNLDAKKYFNINNIPLTDEQSKLLDLVCQNNVVILSGYGGTGKTMTCIALTKMLKDNNKSFLLLAPTGKASKVLSNYTNESAQTIHRALGFQGEYFKYNENNLLPYDCIIVDEATMIDVWLMNSLLKAVNHSYTKLVFVCDTAQIPSVGCGNCMQNLVDSKLIPTVLLEKVFRYKEGGLAKVATCTRKGKQFLDPNCLVNQQVFGENKDYIFISKPKDYIYDEIIRILNKIMIKGVDISDIVILSAYNKGDLGTYKINRIVQEYINTNLEKKIVYQKDKTDIVLQVGDRVIETINKYDIEIYEEDSNMMESEKTNIYNGDEGIVKEIVSDNKIIVEFDGIPILYNKDTVKSLLLSYAISIHKSQGSQYQHVIVLTPPAHKHFLNRNLLYVAFSRAKEKVYNIGTIDTINNSLNKSENLSRNTWLRDLLFNQ